MPYLNYSRRRRDKVIPSGITLRAEELRKVQYLVRLRRTAIAFFALEVNTSEFYSEEPLFEQLNPTAKKLDWNIEHIGAIRDKIENIFVKESKLCTDQKFYPYLKIKK